MPIDRRALALGALAAPALLRAAPARAQDATTLRLHHFLPAVSNVHRFFLQPWAQKVQKESDNRLRVQIFPAMQLGGAPPQLYDQARDGVADIIWTLPGNTPGRFPRVEVFELPFVAHKRAIVNCKAVQEYSEKHLRDEFKEVHPICVWAHGEGLIHARKEVRTMDDLRGLKLRFPSRLNGEALRALGAAPVGMPIPQVPEALTQGVIDGAVVPWEVVPALKLQEMVRHHTEVPGSPTLYTATFILAMNKGRYEQLPPDLKRVLDANSGQAAAAMAAGFAAVVVFHDHADIQPRHRADVGDKPAFRAQDRHLLQGRGQRHRDLHHAGIARAGVVVDLAQKLDPGGEGDPLGRVGGHVQRPDLHGRGGCQNAAALAHGQAGGFGGAAQSGFGNLGGMGIARHLSAHGPQPEALFGGIARVAQPPVVEDQRFRYRMFQEQFAIFRPCRGLAQDRQGAVAVQVGGKGIKGGAAHGGVRLSVGGRGGAMPVICLGRLMYHLPVGTRYGHRTDSVKGKGAALGRPCGRAAAPG